MNPTHLIIFNRSTATADGWIHIVPKGELPNREAGIVQVLDDKALDSILAGIESEKTRLGNKWPGVYAGREHFIYNDDQDSAALAWFKTFEKRADGIWAKDDGLTDLGSEAIKNARYKFTSFVADRKDTQPLGVPPSGGPARVRILKIDTVGFTNQANGKELLTPITNRNNVASALRAEPSSHRLDTTNPFPAASASGANQNTNQRTDTMKSIAEKLGLAPEASEAAILGEVTKVMNRATEAEGKVTPLTNRVTTLETENTTLLTEQIEADFAAAGIKDEKIVNRHKPLLADPRHFKNRAERVEFIKDLVKDGKGTTPARVLNRADGKAPANDTPGDEQELAAKAEAEINDYKIRNRCSYVDARNIVRNQKPELFGIKK